MFLIEYLLPALIGLTFGNLRCFIYDVNERLIVYIEEDSSKVMPQEKYMFRNYKRKL